MRLIHVADIIGSAEEYLSDLYQEEDTVPVSDLGRVVEESRTQCTPPLPEFYLPVSPRRLKGGERK